MRPFENIDQCDSAWMWRTHHERVYVDKVGGDQNPVIYVSVACLVDDYGYPTDA